MYRLLIITIFFFILSHSILSQDYYFEKKSPESGFAFDGVLTIEEDYNGIIWFGCSNGLYRYNTQTFQHYLSKNRQTNTIPDNYINKIFLDSKHNLWICTPAGLCRYNRQTDDFIRIEFNPSIVRGRSHNITDILQANDSTYLCIINRRLYTYNINKDELNILHSVNRQKSSCTAMFKDIEDNIWIGLGGGTILKTDHTLQTIKQWNAFRSSAIASFYTFNNHIWIGYKEAGVDKVDTNGTFIHHYGTEEKGIYKLNHNKVRKIIARNNGDIWVGTFDGINVINDGGNKQIRENKFNYLPHNSILDIKKDKNDGLWFGTWAGGLAHYSHYNFCFRHIERIPYFSKVTRSFTSSFTQTQSGLVYVGTENDGLKTYNPATGAANSITISNKKGNVINIKSLTIDKNDKIWLGTFQSGLWYKNPNENVFRKESHPLIDELSPITKVAANNDIIWICSTGRGVLEYNTKTKTIKRHEENNDNPNGMLSNKTRTVFIDSNENTWLATVNGVCVKKAGSEEFTNLGSKDESLYTFVNYITETAEGEIWAGTQGKGILVFDTINNHFKSLDKEWNDKLLEVYGIVSDLEGHIWIASNLGIQKYNPYTDHIVYFDENDGAIGKNFIPGSCFRMQLGTLLFGGYNGFNAIEPGEIKLNPIKPEVLLANISVNNIDYKNSDIEHLKNKNIDAITKLELAHDKNTLSFSFISNNFIRSHKNCFKYRLTNYQDHWVDLNTKNEVSFTKIPPGHYQLEVLGSNNNDMWSNAPYKLPIRIKPPIWFTWYAIVIYAIAIGLTGYTIYKEVRLRMLIEKKMLMERVNHEADEKLFIDKQKFFTNISHELRTPLTLILSPLNLLIERFKYDQTTNEHLSIVQRNADRLLRLTNEILDFRLIETGKIKFKPTNTNIIEICKSVYDCFTFEAIEREINFIFSSRLEHLDINIDPSKMEKIIFNLLSNAFKYSEDKSQIIVTIEPALKTTEEYDDIFYTGTAFEGNALEIKVKNFGNFIPKDTIPGIFDRFSMENNLKVSGTGLGLHISREYIQLHQGNISVTSSQDAGTTFSVNIPLQETVHARKNFVIQREANDNTQGQRFDEEITLPDLQSDVVILIVEDNVDLKKYLKKTLESRFKILTASNGIQGYEIAQEIIPDLIISDVKMPGMDGTTMTKHLKTNKKTKLVPVILLTAMTDKTDHIAGIKHGADSYLVKPVEIDLLLAQIQNLLQSRKEISKQIMEQNQSIDGKKSASIPNLTFLEKVEIFTIENLLNPQFSVDDLAEKLDMSRSSLYRKIKADSGLSVTQYLRDIRMKKAIELMKENKYNLEEIGSLVGFNSHSYFTRTFKSKYGKTPKDFYNDVKKPKPNH